MITAVWKILFQNNIIRTQSNISVSNWTIIQYVKPCFLSEKIKVVCIPVSSLSAYVETLQLNKKKKRISQLIATKTRSDVAICINRGKQKLGIEKKNFCNCFQFSSKPNCQLLAVFKISTSAILKILKESAASKIEKRKTLATYLPSMASLSYCLEMF